MAADLYPNGITQSGDGNLLFIADMLGVIRVDLRMNKSVDVDPGPHDTLSGIDGLYWHRGEFVGVRYGNRRVSRYVVEAFSRWAQSYVKRGSRIPYGFGERSDHWGDLGRQVYFLANAGIYNMQNDKIVDRAKLEPVHIAVVPVRWELDESMIQARAGVEIALARI